MNGEREASATGETGEVARKTERDAPPGPASDRRWTAWVAVAGVFVVPSLLWAAILLVPFLPLATGQKVWVVGGLAVAAEVVFWISALLVGREIARRYRRRLDPRAWIRKRTRWLRRK